MLDFLVEQITVSPIFLQGHKKMCPFMKTCFHVTRHISIIMIKSLRNSNSVYIELYGFITIYCKTDGHNVE